MRVAAPWIPDGSRVLDIGCHEGEFLDYLGSRIIHSVGIDPLAPETATENYRLIASTYDDYTEFQSNSFDAVVMLATLEHIRSVDEIALECVRILKPNGRVVLTVPSLFVDTILDVLRTVRLVEGMSLEEHHGLDPDSIPHIFGGASFSLRKRRRFQLGLNNLFVFEKN